MVNLGGISFDHRMTEESGASVADVARAFIASRNIFRFTDHWREIDALGSTIALDTQIDLLLEVRRMSERGTTWLLRHFPPPMHIDTAIATFAPGIDLLAGSLGRTWAGASPSTSNGFVYSGSPKAFPPTSPRVRRGGPGCTPPSTWSHLAFSENCEVERAAETYGAVFEAFDIGWMWDGIGALPRSDRWQTQARSSMRDDLMNVIAELTAQRDALGGRVARRVDRGERAGGRPHHRDAPGDPASREFRPHDAVGRAAPAAQPHDLRRRLTSPRLGSGS